MAGSTHVCTECGDRWTFGVPWPEEDIEVEHAVAARCNGRIVQIAKTQLERFGQTLASVGMKAGDFEDRVAAFVRAAI